MAMLNNQMVALNKELAEKWASKFQMFHSSIRLHFFVCSHQLPKHFYWFFIHGLMSENSFAARLAALIVCPNAKRRAFWDAFSICCLLLELIFLPLSTLESSESQPRECQAFWFFFSPSRWWYMEVDCRLLSQIVTYTYTYYIYIIIYVNTLHTSVYVYIYIYIYIYICIHIWGPTNKLGIDFSWVFKWTTWPYEQPDFSEEAKIHVLRSFFIWVWINTY